MKHKVCARERVFEHLPTVSSSLFPFGGYCYGEKLHPFGGVLRSQVLGRDEVCAKQPLDGRLLPGERRRRMV